MNYPKPITIIIHNLSPPSSLITHHHHRTSLTPSFTTLPAEPILLDAEYKTVMMLTGALLFVLVIGVTVASFVCKSWQKEKKRASELERAKAITQHWIKKVSRGACAFYRGILVASTFIGNVLLFLCCLILLFVFNNISGMWGEVQCESVKV